MSTGLHQISRLICRRKKSKDVPLEQLYRDIDAGYRRFWSRRMVDPRSQPAGGWRK